MDRRMDRQTDGWKKWHIEVGTPPNKTIFVVVLNSMNKIFQEHFLDNPVFRLVAILNSMNKIFEKQLQRNTFLRYLIHTNFCAY